MILYGSRYITSTVLSIQPIDGVNGITTVLDRYHFTLDNLKYGWRLKTAEQNSEFDLISFRITGRSDLWFLIADVNDILDPFEDVVANTELVIPNKQSFDSVGAALNKNA